MTTPFGPQLIGETEKTLNALLRCVLEEGSGLTEPLWVTLRLAALHDGQVDADGLVAAVTRRAHFAQAAELVGELTDRGLLEGGRLTAAGRGLADRILGRIEATTAGIWRDLPADDVLAASRVLGEVIARGHAILGSIAGPREA